MSLKHPPSFATPPQPSTAIESMARLPANDSPTQLSHISLVRWRDILATTWDKTSIYLPIVLMGFLALVSYWALSVTPQIDFPKPEQTLSQAPDSIMRNFAIRQFSPDGSLKSEIFGREMRRYPYNDKTVVDDIKGLQIAPNGHRTTFTANRLTTNTNQSIYWLEGNVVVIREAHSAVNRAEPQVEYRGQAITLYVEQDRLESSKPVSVVRGADRISGNSLRYDDNAGVVNMQGRVRAVLSPRP